MASPIRSKTEGRAINVDHAKTTLIRSEIVLGINNIAVAPAAFCDV